MSYNVVLVTLFEHINQTNQPVLVSWADTQQWPDGSLNQLLSTGLLEKASPVESIECTGCEKACFMDVLIHSNSSVSPQRRAFVACDDPDMQSEIGRIQIPLGHLQQWKFSAKQLAKVIAGLLELEIKPEQQQHQASIRLGMMSSKHGRRWISLNVQPLCLEVNQRTAPIDEVLYFVGDELTLDYPRINEMLYAAPLQQGKQYTPSTSKREEGNRKTEAMHQDWRDAYLRLKRQSPEKNGVWISQQIARLPIANGRQAATIYRKMKG